MEYRLDSWEYVEAHLQSLLFWYIPEIIGFISYDPLHDFQIKSGETLFCCKRSRLRVVYGEHCLTCLLFKFPHYLVFVLPLRFQTLRCVHTESFDFVGISHEPLEYLSCCERCLLK